MAKLTMQEEAGTPSTPSANTQSFFFKSDGLYSINSAGVVTGPYPTGAGLISGSYTLLDGRYQPTGTIPALSGVVTGSYTLLDGRYLPSGTTIPVVPTGTYNIQFFMGNGGSVVPTGSVVGGYHYVEVPYASQVESWSMLADATGSITVNVLKSSYAGFPPASPLAGLGQPKLTNQRKNNGTPTGTVTLDANDVLLVEVVDSSTVKTTDLSLRARKL